MGSQGEARGGVCPIQTEAMSLIQKRVDCLDWVGRELLSQVKEFKHLGILFTSQGRLEHQQVDQQVEWCRSSSNAKCCCTELSW